MKSSFRGAAALAAAAALCACDVSINGGNEGNGGNAAAAAQPASKRYVNSRDKAGSDALRRNYVDFSFDYPGHWQETPQPTDGTAANYVRVAAPSIHGYVPYAVHVGFAAAEGTPEEARAALERLTPDFARDFGRGFDNYQIVSMGPGRVGRYDSFGWRFTASAPPQKGEPGATVYGRGDIVLPPGATRGVMIITVATDRAQDVSGPQDIGEGGPVKAIFDSLEVAGSGGAATP
jgi:hypothetical protein